MRGPRHIDVASQSDPILVRADGTYLYGFTSVVDDIAFGITHVIRSEDHVTKSGAQIQMFRALDAAVPAFGHLPLLVDATGGGLSKRTGSLAVADLRERGGDEGPAPCALLALSYEAEREHLPEGVGEAFWLAVRGNLSILADSAGWAQIVRGPIGPKVEDPDFSA